MGFPLIFWLVCCQSVIKSVCHSVKQIRAFWLNICKFIFKYQNPEQESLEPRPYSVVLAIILFLIAPKESKLQIVDVRDIT